MILGKINPTAKTQIQKNSFEVDVKEVQYMAVIARPYVLGADNTTFEVIFGNLVYSTDDPTIVHGFDRVFNTQVNLSSTELEGWGEDDVVALEAVASKIGTVVESTLNVPYNN